VQDLEGDTSLTLHLKRYTIGQVLMVADKLQHLLLPLSRWENTIARNTIDKCQLQKLHAMASKIVMLHGGNRDASVLLQVCQEMYRFSMQVIHHNVPSHASCNVTCTFPFLFSFYPFFQYMFPIYTQKVPQEYIQSERESYFVKHI
jgi:hypothetical protein